MKRMRTRSARLPEALRTACAHAGILIWALVLAGNAAAAEDLRLGIGVASTYSDNPLQYSDGQIRLFEAGTAPSRYSIHSAEDVTWTPYLSLMYRYSPGRGRGREILLRGTGAFHRQNATADSRAMSLRWRELFGRGRRMELRGYYLPHYYLRQLYDEDYAASPGGVSRYRRAEFSLAVGSLSWRQPLGRRIRGEAGYRYEHRGYNRDFEERSSRTHQGEVSLEWYRFPRGGAVEIRGGYRKSLARGVDSDGVPNDDPDVSYHGILIGASGRARLAQRRSWRLSGDLDYDYATRSYESARVQDTIHYRRNDRRHAVEASLRCRFPAYFDLRAFYRREQNSADFPAGTGPTSDPTSYTENEFGLALDWSTVLWSRVGRTPIRDEADSP